MRVDELIVEVRNPDLSREGRLSAEDLTDFSVIPEVNAVGSWELHLPATETTSFGRFEHRLAAKLKIPGAGIIVTNDNVPGPDGVYMSGPMLNALFESSVEDPYGTWTFVGVSDLIHIEDALAYGDPSKYSLASQDAANDTRTGPAETLVLGYIAGNIGPLAVAERKRPGMTVAASLGRGPALQKSPRFQNLLELVQECFTGTRLSVEVVQVDSHLHVRVREAVDRSASIRLDQNNGQVTSTKYSLAGPEVTDVIVAGQGEGTARKMLRRGVSSPWGRRIERFLDQRSTDDDIELQQAGDEELADAAADEKSFQVVPNSDLGLTLGVDYNLGDIVSIVVDGGEIPVPLLSTPISVSEGTVFVGATAGSPMTTDWEDVADVRLQRLERRQSRQDRSL